VYATDEKIISIAVGDRPMTDKTALAVNMVAQVSRMIRNSAKVLAVFKVSTRMHLVSPTSYCDIYHTQLIPCLPS
jgi:hypothetical protein